jgi:DtxR family Mn-dependent transcriptional regulator
MKELSQSAQDYLEAVYETGRNSDVVRVSEVADRLGVKMPSVVTALRRLARRGLVRHERYGHVALTEAGAAEARRVSGRHHAIVRFLVDLLGVDARTAEIDACRMEHAVSARTMRRMVRLLEFAVGGPGDEGRCAGRFRRFVDSGVRCDCGR